MSLKELLEDDENKPKTPYRRFKEWMKFNPPYALGMKGWGEFDARFKKEAPIRHFLVKTAPDSIRPLKWRWERSVSWLRFRVVRYHIVDTGLTPDYYETEELILNANFNLLKNFVEVQKGWMYAICHSDEIKLDWKERWIPFYRQITFSRADLGIKYLEWEATLDSEELDPMKRNPHQAIKAREVLELYRWWTEIRPNRKEVDHVEYDDQGLYGGCLNEDFDKDAVDWQASQKAYNYQEQQEEDWDTEDTDMLIRLIKIRKELWT